MNIPKPSSSYAWKLLALSGLTAFVIGCGSSGDDPVIGSPSPTGNTPVATLRTFQFPSFSPNSKLTVVANFETADQNAGTTGVLSATLSNFGSPMARFSPPSSEGPESASSSIDPCGLGDAFHMNKFIGESHTAQSVGDPGLRFQRQDLPAGTQQDFVIIPAGLQTVVGQKILEPSQTVHCTIFAEVRNGAPVIDENKALMVAQAFDSNNPQRPGSGIYSQVRSVFGSEWNQNPVGGNDGDTKIVIFFFSSQTAGAGLYGYTSPADANPTGGALSNKGEIIYVNADKSDYQTLATICHEFQHLINQNQKVSQQGLNPASAQDENLTINEGLSELAEEVCGYTLESGNELMAIVCNDYLGKPQEHKFFNFHEAGNGYGQGYLFFKFVREHFGDQVIREICTNPATGLANLDSKIPGGFAQTFRRWTIANYATNLDGPVPLVYTYPSGFKTNRTYAGGTLTGVATQPLPGNQETSSGPIKPWSVRYMTTEGGSGNGVTAQILPPAGAPFGIIFEQTSGFLTSLQQ